MLIHTLKPKPFSYIYIAGAICGSMASQEDFDPRIALEKHFEIDTIGVSKPVKKKASELCELAFYNGITGTPDAIASAAVYIATEGALGQVWLSEQFGVNHSTFRNCLSRFEDTIEEIDRSAFAGTLKGTHQDREAAIAEIKEELAIEPEYSKNKLTAAECREIADRLTD